MVVYVPPALGATVDAEARDGSVRLDSALAFDHDADRARNVSAAASAWAVRASCSAAATAASVSDA